MATREQDVLTAWFKPRKHSVEESVIIKREKCSRGNSEPRAKEAILSALQVSLLGLVVYDLAPATGVSSLPIKPI